MSDSLASLLSLALPPRCPGCATPVDCDHRFCATCWQGLHFLRPPWCARCNRPFDYDRGEGAWCASCLADPPRVDGIRAAVAYGAVARRLALKLKYGGRIGVADTMAALLAPTMADGADLLVPVPLHRWRLWSRAFNQAVLIARALSRHTDVPVEIGALVRTRRTAVLRGLDRRRRRRAVAGAFRVVERSLVEGRAIVLVDDVYTSGATADACARVLLKAGAASVSVACWARVVGDDPAAH
ncbi:ComF family protein [Sphingomonas oligophenolica]|uniref:ComF family protein n=1 Tax=Sphingomonas oligophenolica TaxID=301154 RepID=A0A502CL63_9SPHN|nr:ComF family protein [Sphingomonas oligophenolica]